jgi:hypothetical protein
VIVAGTAAVPARASIVAEIAITARASVIPEIAFATRSAIVTAAGFATLAAIIAPRAVAVRRSRTAIPVRPGAAVAALAATTMLAVVAFPGAAVCGLVPLGPIVHGCLPENQRYRIKSL